MERQEVKDVMAYIRCPAGPFTGQGGGGPVCAAGNDVAEQQIVPEYHFSGYIVEVALFTRHASLQHVRWRALLRHARAGTRGAVFVPCKYIDVLRAAKRCVLNMANLS